MQELFLQFEQETKKDNCKKRRRIVLKKAVTLIGKIRYGNSETGNKDLRLYRLNKVFTMVIR